jgi:hypothetical protein
MDVLFSLPGFGCRRIELFLFDDGPEVSVFRGVCDGVVVFFEVGVGWELWDVLRVAVDSFKVEFGLLNDGL